MLGHTASKRLIRFDRLGLRICVPIAAAMDDEEHVATALLFYCFFAETRIARHVCHEYLRVRRRICAFHIHATDTINPADWLQCFVRLFIVPQREFLWIAGTSHTIIPFPYTIEYVLYSLSSIQTRNRTHSINQLNIRDAYGMHGFRSHTRHRATLIYIYHAGRVVVISIVYSLRAAAEQLLDGGVCAVYSYVFFIFFIILQNLFDKT